MRLKDFTELTPNHNGQPIDGNVSFVPMESLRNREIDLKEIPFSQAAGKYTFFANGDLLIAKVTPCFENGNIAIANDLLNGVGFGSSEIFVLRVNKKKALNTYMFYVSETEDFQGKACATMHGVGGLKRIDPLFMRTYEFNLPPLEVQQRIVSYLDAKTAKIDHAVSLLQKKRDAYTRLKTSIINRAVTRGLNPNVKFKDSGVDWIGMIPENWIIRRFKEVFSHYTTGFTPESKNAKNFEGQNTWITIADMTHKYVSESNLYLSDEAIQKAQQPITPKGSLLFSFKLSIGKVAFAGKNVYTNEAIVSLMPSNRYNLNFFYYYLPIVCLNNATENIYGAKMLNQKIISNMIFAVPPKEEQLAIADYLDTHCSRIDHAISIVDKQIDAYTRLKKSLINEVVTGKRKV